MNFTASVTPASPPSNATGSVTFTSISSAAVVTTLCSNVAVVYSAAVTGPPAVPQANQASCAASFSTSDTDTITAIFIGTRNYSSSSGTLIETISSSVSAATSVSSTTLTENHLATAFSPVTGMGGTGTLTYTVLPALPMGLSFSTTGTVSGTPTTTSVTAIYTVTVTDANNATATATFSLTIDSSVVATQGVATSNLTVNQAPVSFIPVVGSEGFGSASYSVSPPLPAGLSFASNTGTITGTPTITSATATYIVTVADTNNASATANFSLTVNAEAVTIIFAVPNHTYGDAAFSVNASSNSAGTFTYMSVGR